MIGVAKSKFWVGGTIFWFLYSTTVLDNLSVDISAF